jgi:hypothetical protein
LGATETVKIQKKEIRPNVFWVTLEQSLLKKKKNGLSLIKLLKHIETYRNIVKKRALLSIDFITM